MSGSDDWDRKNNSARENDSIGYRRPPVATRFKPGQSGNPKGRKKGQKNLATIINEALYRPVKIHNAGRARTLSKLEAIVEIMLHKALAGDRHAFSKIIELADKLGYVFPTNLAFDRPNLESAREKLERFLEAHADELQSGAPEQEVRKKD